MGRLFSLSGDGAPLGMAVTLADSQHSGNDWNWNRAPQPSYQNLDLDFTRYRHKQSTANATNRKDNSLTFDILSDRG